MAKEATIRKHARSNLLQQDYAVSVPCRSRYGAFVNYTSEDDHKRGDDLFGIYDLVAWKNDEFRLVQYTSVSNMNARVKKVENFLEKADVTIPAGCSSEVWGYIHNSGGDFEIVYVPEK